MTKNFTKGAAAAAVLAALIGCSTNDTSNTRAESFTLTIAHMNDTHSNFDPVKSSFTTGSDGQLIYNEFGGYPRLLQASNDIIEAAEQADKPLLLLHGGDAWQGTVYFSLNKGAANADLLSKMHIDAMAMGNHEFDLSTTELAAFIDEVNFPVLAANIDAGADAQLSDSDNLKAYQLFAFSDGVNKRLINDPSEAAGGEVVVAVIGIALEDMASMSEGVGDVKFAGEIASTQQTVDQLTAAGVNKIVLLTHIGTERDILLAQGTTGVDVIVGGHSHTLLGDFTELGFGDNGGYAQLITQKDGLGKTCIVQAGQYAQAIGVAEVEFDADGDLASCSGSNTLLSNDQFYNKEKRDQQDLLVGGDKNQVVDYISSEPKIAIVDQEPGLRAHIDSTYKPAYDAAFGDVIAKVNQTINQERRPGDKGTDKHGSDTAPIIAQSFLHWANQDAVKAVTGKNVQIAFMPAGGVRTGISAGEMKEGNVTFEMLPFNTYLSVLTLTGKEIKAVLESTITQTLKRDAHAGKFPYVGGMRYTFTETARETAGYISSLEVNSGTESAPVWEKIQDRAEYGVVLGNYNANGRDGWDVIAQAQEKQTDRTDVVVENGTYVGYKVNKLNFNAARGNYSPQYQTVSAVNCKASGVSCNTDAQAFISYAKSKGVIAPIDYETTTMHYAK
ncbi:bifunctional metallophosphatase/5'-nucleotidase [Psychromonas ossibalaenae]|uniref:bifunctional metallophosphatase/5'-nucleotidase n=1 Tax=Psychromonas ossibalaenae TaxID=444922 RepID=UPI00036E760B|nr:bifunctional metallophosphatase/5'-nucleotidase [Psychromonas ossibalaenae]